MSKHATWKYKYYDVWYKYYKCDIIIISIHHLHMIIMLTEINFHLHLLSTLVSIINTIIIIYNHHHHHHHHSKTIIIIIIIWFLTLLLAFTSTPYSKRVCTISWWPFWLAMMRAVYPNIYKNNEEMRHGNKTK